MRGYDQEVPDNVVRKDAFLAAHPGVTIHYHGKPDWNWTAEWEDGSGKHKLTNGELAGLLDQLDEEFDC